MNSTTPALLRTVPLFAGLEQRFLEEIASRAHRRRFGPGEAIFREGDPGHALYVVVSGSLRIQRVAPDGELIHLAERGPGEHVGELALIDGKLRMADAVTGAATELLMLDRNAFLSCLEKSPAASIAILTCLAERLREAANDLERQRQQSLLGRLSAVLLELGRDHGESTPDGLRIAIPITRREIASRVGAARESVSRALGSLKDAGAITTHGRTIIIRNPDRLRHYARSSPS